MIKYSVLEIPYNLVIGMFVGFALVLMFKDAVIKIMTFVKGLDLE